MKDQDIPLHKWERIQAELDRTRAELANEKLNLEAIVADFRTLKDVRDILLFELSIWHKADAVLDADPSSTDDPCYVNIQRIISQRDQFKAEVERLANNNKLLLVQQEHEEQMREFLRCEVETLKSQIGELINQRNQLLKKETAWHDMARELKLALGNDGMLADNPLSALARDAALDRFDAMEKQP